MGSPEHSMPEDKLPACWSDDVRMNALFAPFRLKSANPESWQMKMKFWSDMLRQWCRCRNDPVVSASDAKVAFIRKGRTPACLDIVFEECIRSGELSPVSKYQQALYNGPEGWIRWGARLAFMPASFAATAITSLLPGRQATDSDGLPKASIDSTQKFVLESVLKEQATDFLRNYPSDAERMGTVEEIMAYTKYPDCRRESLEMILGYLVIQGQAVKKGDIVKFAETPSARVCGITESDEALHRLLAAEKTLVTDSERYHKESERALEDATVAMKLGNKIAAKKHLRRKHKCLESAAKCDSALDNVRQLLHNMKQMEVNTAVVNTYKMSADAMKKSMKDGGLTEDAAHDTMDELKEVMETYTEVERAIAGSVEDVDMQELEQELAELMTGPGPSGGTPGKDERIRAPKVPGQQSRRKVSEKEFIFDGEERIIAELNELSVEDRSPEDKRGRRKIPVAAPGSSGDNTLTKDEQKPVERSGKLWYPRQEEFLKDGTKNPWRVDEENNLDRSYEALCNSFMEVKMDDRLHPGQKLDVDFRSPAQVYSGDFQVQDHNVEEHVWLYNTNDANQNSEALCNSTEYYSAESPGKSGSNFQMAPGGERKLKPQLWPEDGVEDLEKRLRNLRKFNL